MYRLTRDVRFNLRPGETAGPGGNGHAGTPAVDGPAVHWTVRVTLAGEPDPVSAYLIDIKAVDDIVRRVAAGVLVKAVTAGRPALPGVARAVFDVLRDAWPGRTVARVELIASPFQSAAVDAGEKSMTQLSQHFEFSAAHRLHNAALSDDENRRLFGKCNNPAGHGHNYEVRVTIAGTPDAHGRLIGVAELERLVDEHAIRKVDHRHLNEQVPEFATLNPSVENIARVIYDWLASQLKRPHAALKSVTVWETPKTSCEYSGGHA